MPKKYITTVFVLVALLSGCGAPKPDAAAEKALIVAGDPRFDLFELSNSAGDRTFPSPEGIVYLSFATNDSRYCRAARIHADRTALLACRNGRGWQIEAVSPFAAGGANTVSGGGIVTREINDVIAALNPTGRMLDEREIIEAAGKGWR